MYVYKHNRMESLNKHVFFYIHIDTVKTTCLKSLIIVNSERTTMESAEDTTDFTQSSRVPDRATYRPHLIICSQVN